MKRWMARMAALAVGMMLLGGCASQRPVFSVTDVPIGPPLVGFGACMNPYLYAYPNWPGEINEKNVGDLEKKVKELRPQFVRIFFLNSWWDQDTDPVIAKNHPGMKQSLIRTIKLAQDAGAKVLLQFWYDPKRYVDPEGVARRFAMTIREMRLKYGLTSVAYVTMQNEPNDEGKDITREQYVRLYRGLDKSLRDLGLREEIQIVGGDLLSPKQTEWFHFMGKELAPVLDGYAVHAYWSYWDTNKLVRRVKDTRRDVDSLPEAARKPVYVTEFGVQGKRPKPNVEPGTYDDGRPLADVPAACAQLGWFVMEALNNGFAGTCQWDLYEVWYDRKMGYGVIGNAQQGFPERPGYWLMKMFTHSVEPGWRTMKVEGEGKDVIVSAIKGSSGETLFVLNRGKSREISLRGFRPDTSLACEIWNGDGTGTLMDGQKLMVDHEGCISLKAVKKSVTMLKN